MNEVLTALQTLYTDPSSSAKESANRWLQNFQKEVSPTTNKSVFVQAVQNSVNRGLAGRLCEWEGGL